MEHAPDRRQTDEPALEQLRWVQRLAHRLCADHALAEDLGQEVLLGSLERGAAPKEDPGAWLRGALKNRLRMASRSRGRRHEHEQSAARERGEDPAHVDPGKLLERFETHRRVSKAVAALREPYRSTVLLRYFEGLTPTEIAAREGAPVATVKTRLTRALKELKAELRGAFGSDDGDDTAWFAALLPLAQMHRPLPAPAPLETTGASEAALPAAASQLSAAPIAALVALAAAATGAWWLTDRGTPDADRIESVAREATTSAHGDDRGTLVAAPSAARTPAEHEDRTASSPAPLLTTDLTVNVVTVHGAPISGVTVQREAEGTTSSLGVTDGGGALRARVPLESAALTVRAAGRAVVLPGAILELGGTQEATVVLSDARPLDGVVLGPSAQPLVDAEVILFPGGDLRLLQSRPLDRASRPTWTTRTDANGRFAFDAAPELPGAQLAVIASGLGRHEFDAPDEGPATVELRIEESAPGSVRGRVLDEAAAPVPGAVVAAGARSTWTDDNGRFQLEVDFGAPLVVRALKAGVGSGAWRGGADEAKAELTLRLDTPPAPLSARVLDAQGHPAAGRRVLLLDRTDFGVVAPRTSEESFTYWSVEGLLGEERTRTKTDANGRFTLVGAEGEDYRIVVADAASLTAETFGPFTCGEAVPDLILAAPGATRTVRGRVTDTDGRPLAGAMIQTRRRLPRAESSNLIAPALRGPMGFADENGDFVLEPLPDSDALELQVFAGANHEAQRHAIEPGDVTLDLRLPRVAAFYLRRNARAELLSDDQFQLLDARTLEPLQLAQTEQLGMFQLAVGELLGPRSPVYRARVGRHVLVVRRSGEEILRTTVEIQPESGTQVIDL